MLNQIRTKPFQASKLTSQGARTFFLVGALLLAPALLVTADVSPSEDTETRPPVQHVILASGLNRDPDQLRDKAQAVTRLHRFFLRTTKTPTERLHVLTAPDSLAAHLGVKCSAESVLATLSAIAEEATPTDRVVFYFVGQANIVGGQLRLNLPGPDLTHSELAVAMASIEASEILVVLDCPGAGLAVNALRGPNRIIIAAARSDQPHSTRFSSFFVPALANPSGDFNDDGQTSLLESFQMAAQEIDALFREERLMKNETPLLEDDNDGEPSQSPWRYATSGKDGQAAAQYFWEASPAGDPSPPTLSAIQTKDLALDQTGDDTDVSAQ